MISILCPTRGRAAKAEKFAKSVLENAADRDSVEILFYIDSDDPEMSDYTKRLVNLQGCRLIYGRPDSVSRSWNVLAHFSRGDFLIMGNDDLEYKTGRWDAILRQQIKRIGKPLFCAWMNDGINGDKHCAFPIVPRLWYETLGRFTAGVFEFGYNDTWIFSVARQAGCIHYLDMIVATHHHGSVSKENIDETYRRNRGTSGKWGRDKKRFAKFKPMMRIEAQIVREINDAGVG